jgi:hypothetical protein
VEAKDRRGAPERDTGVPERDIGAPGKRVGGRKNAPKTRVENAKKLKKIFARLLKSREIVRFLRPLTLTRS